eukprot:COSAG06_NODE_43_length_29826_cov_32.009621_22_plen_143_part_00
MEGGRKHVEAESGLLAVERQWNHIRNNGTRDLRASVTTAILMLMTPRGKNKAVGLPGLDKEWALLKANCTYEAMTKMKVKDRSVTSPKAITVAGGDSGRNGADQHWGDRHRAYADCDITFELLAGHLPQHDRGAHAVQPDSE